MRVEVYMAPQRVCLAAHISNSILGGLLTTVLFFEFLQFSFLGECEDEGFGGDDLGEGDELRPQCCWRTHCGGSGAVSGMGSGFNLDCRREVRSNKRSNSSRDVLRVKLEIT